MTAHDHREYVEGCFRCDLSRAETAPDAAGIEAALAAGLAAHLFTLYPGEIVCDCEWANRDDDTRQGERRMIAAHCAHVAAALLPVVTQAQADERERVAQAIEAEASRMHAAFAAEEDAHLADMKNRLGVDLEPGHWNRHDDGCGMCGMSSAARIARADESGA